MGHHEYSASRYNLVLFFVVGLVCGLFVDPVHSFGKLKERPNYNWGMFSYTEAVQSIQGLGEFHIARHEGLAFIDYDYCFPGTFDGLRENLRGTVFNEARDEIISLPLHKFWNVDQSEEYAFEKLKHCQATIYEKLDGSMIQWFRHPYRDNQLTASTARSMFMPMAKEAYKLAEEGNVLSLIAEHVDSGWTPIFEYTSPLNSIVVYYDKPGLTYLISRHRETGKYWVDDRFPIRAKSYSFPFSEVLERTKELGNEGYVCWLDNGMACKVKTDWYMARHHVHDHFLRPMHKLFGLVFEGVMDDVIASAADQYKGKLQEIYLEAQHDLLSEKQRLQAMLETAKQSVGFNGPQDRKALFFHLKENYATDLKSLLLVLDEKEIVNVVADKLMKKYEDKYPLPIFGYLSPEGSVT